MQKYYSFTWSHLNSVKRSWETGHLRGVGIFSWGSVFTGSGRKIGWRIVLTIWFFCYAKNRVNNQIVVGGILLVGKMIEFFATIFWNHDLLFIIKHFESILGITKKILGYEYLKIYYSAQISEKILLWKIFRKSVNDGLASCNNMK